MDCPKCGAENRSDAQFCRVCSIPFAEVSQDAPAPAAAAVSAANDAAAARSVDRDGRTPESADAAQDDPFFAARMEEKEWFQRRRRLIEAAGGLEAYEAGLREQLVASKRGRRLQSVAFQGILLVGAVAGLALAVSYAHDWARLMASLPGAGGTAGGQMTQVPGVGQAFGIAIALLLASSIVGSSVARLGRKSLWGVIAVFAIIGVQVALLSPYIAVQGSSPVGSGSAFGISAFVLATLIGGSLGAAYGGQDFAD